MQSSTETRKTLFVRKHTGTYEHATGRFEENSMRFASVNIRTGYSFITSPSYKTESCGY